MRHKWTTPYPIGVDECEKCYTTRTVYDRIKCFAWLTYHRPDGIQFTNITPECDPDLKFYGRPITAMLGDAIIKIWRIL